VGVDAAQARGHGQVGGGRRVALELPGQAQVGDGVEVPPGHRPGRLAPGDAVEDRAPHDRRVPGAPPDRQPAGPVAGGVDLRRQLDEARDREVAGHEVDDVELVGLGMADGRGHRGVVEDDTGGGDRGEVAVALLHAGGRRRTEPGRLGVENREAADPGPQPHGVPGDGGGDERAGGRRQRSPQPTGPARRARGSGPGPAVHRHSLRASTR
jgi:hypothetical protein